MRASGDGERIPCDEGGHGGKNMGENDEGRPSKAEIVSALKAAFANKQLPDLESGNMVFMMSKSACLYEAGDHNEHI